MGPNDDRPTPVIASATERMVFSVASEDPKHRGKRYRVDLLANRGAGQCSCKNHAVKAQPALNQAMPTWTARTTCKHVRKAARYFMVQLFEEMARKEKSDE